ncbi:MAG TPA: antibiotic biosynthesis monooxygenase family protein [Steroidobacteraceae bacterium]|nr:antibiotic biosynthesis monooxygenase family protein [Steroidobacteraceae bacterium]
MLLERSEVLIKEGLENEFATAMKEHGIALLSRVPGVKSVCVGRGVENPGKFMLLVEWESMEAHTAYGKTPSCGALRELIRPFSKGGSMEHFRMG